MTDRERLLKRFKSLKQYSELSAEELEKAVDRKLEEEELVNSLVGLNEDEKEKATQLYEKYITENSFENLAEKSSLSNLIYLEMMNDRIKTFIGKENDEKDGAVPLHMMEQFLANNEQILKLKERLGMLKTKDSDSFVKLWDDLKKKALTYYNEHAGETFIKCPECNKIFRLLMKMDDLVPAKASMFRGTTLYNVKLMKLLEEKKLTIDEIAEVMGVHQKYIEFIYQNIYLKDKEKES